MMKLVENDTINFTRTAIDNNELIILENKDWARLSVILYAILTEAIISGTLKPLVFERSANSYISIS